MKKLKVFCLLSLLASCSYIDKNVDLVEIDVNKNLVGKNNEDILKDKELKDKVFDKRYRKINNNLKGVWVSTVLNLDFPTKASLDEKEQKREIENIVKEAKDMGLNAIFFQVKPTNDAFYNSKNLPWSKYLTGKEDTKPSYDPLEYFIEVAHKNNMELHAWINPYRVSMNTDLSKISEKNIVKKHPDWVFTYEGKMYLNPAKPGVVKYLYENIEEIVKNYDVDGIHLDDYFYPYPVAGKPLPNFDKKEYEQYAELNQSLADFRRENVNNLIKNLSVSIHKIKPELAFGISPFGIWRNEKDDIRGSKTNGLASYDNLYADVVKWMENSWIDYVAPQIYWDTKHEKANYETLVKWWNDVSYKTNTTLYIGEGIYKFKDWDTNEISKHRKIRNANDNVKGYIIFRYKTLDENRWLSDEI